MAGQDDGDVLQSLLSMHLGIHHIQGDTPLRDALLISSRSALYLYDLTCSPSKVMTPKLGCRKPTCWLKLLLLNVKRSGICDRHIKSQML